MRERIAIMETRLEGVDAVLKQHLRDCRDAHESADKRMAKLERVIYQAAGAVTVILGVIQFLAKG